MMKLERYGHGGDLRTASELYGVSESDWLDFSSNMNPLGPPDAVAGIMRDRWQDIVRYPDPAVRGLRAKLAAKYDIPVDSILVGNGAAELIDLAVRVLNPQETVLARPSFKEYEDAVRKVSGRVRDVSLSADNRFELDAASVLPYVDEGRWLFLGHPNNPTGRIVPSETLRALADAGARMILDEAFIDFVPDEMDRSYIRQAAASEKIVVIRSMTKFYSVPGIRLGFIVAHPLTIARMKELQTAWSVNYLAQLIGEAVLEDEAFAKRTLKWLGAERPRYVERLTALGLEVVPSDVNFVLVSLPEGGGWTAPKLQQAMAERGIMIRDASLFNGLDASYFRLAVRLPEQNDRLLSTLGSVLHGAG